MQKAQEKGTTIRAFPGAPLKRRFGSEGSSTDKTHPKGSSANETCLNLPKLVVESFYWKKSSAKHACMPGGNDNFFVPCLIYSYVF